MTRPGRQLAASATFTTAAMATVLAGGASHWQVATAAAAAGLLAVGWFLAAWRRTFPPVGARGRTRGTRR